MDQQVPVDTTAVVADIEQDGVHEIAPDLAYQRLAMVNVVYHGTRANRRWTLVDAGIPGSADAILDAVHQRFGDGTRPAAILLTHGHFDHVGALEQLAEQWEVPIYSHALEQPYLDGRTPYPPPDPSLGGGLMAAASRLYPRGAVDVGRWLRTLPEDGAVPGMPGWRWIHTPGHTRGHVSFWRQSDRTLIAGDAFITTRQESAYAVSTQRAELHGPPMYYTTDWRQARASVERLAALEPELAIAGHGPALRGAELREALRTLASEFDRVAVPERGRHVHTPQRSARSEDVPDADRERM